MNDLAHTGGVPENMDMGGFDDAIGELTTGDPIVRFVNGKWKWSRSTSEKVTLELGQRIAMNVFETERGWLHFATTKDEKSGEITVVDQRRIGKVRERFKPEPRKDLGDTDNTKWRLDSDSNPLDPWVHVWQIPAVLIGKEGNYRVEVSGSALGWERSVGQLFQDWKAQLPMNQGKAPIIELGSREGKTKYGERDFPVMKIVDWKSLEELKVAEAPDQNEPEQKAAEF